MSDFTLKVANYKSDGETVACVHVDEGHLVGARPGKGGTRWINPAMALQLLDNADHVRSICAKAIADAEAANGKTSKIAVPVPGAAQTEPLDYAVLNADQTDWDKITKTQAAKLAAANPDMPMLHMTGLVDGKEDWGTGHEKASKWFPKQVKGELVEPAKGPLAAKIEEARGKKLAS